MTNTPDFPALVELASRLEGKDKKTCELALYTLKKQDERIDKRNARIAALEAALKPFARAYEMGNKWSAGPNRGDLREAYKAIGGEGWQFRTSSGENKELDIMDHMYLIGVEWGEKKARAAMEGK